MVESSDADAESVPREFLESLAERAVAEAVEDADVDVPAGITIGPDARDDHELDYDWRNVLDDYDSIDVEPAEDGYELVVRGEVEARYQTLYRKAKRNPPGKAHPAEYENHYVPVYIEVRWRPRDGLSADAAVYGEVR